MLQEYSGFSKLYQRVMNFDLRKVEVRTHVQLILNKNISKINKDLKHELNSCW